MKKVVLILFVGLFTMGSWSVAQVQVKGNGEVVKQDRPVDSFTSVKVGGARDVVLIPGDQFKVIVETDANLQEFVEVEVKNNTLEFSDKKTIRKYTAMTFYITLPTLETLRVSGAADVKTLDVLKGDDLKIYVSGASDVSLDLDYSTLMTDVSGASDVTLRGKASVNTVQCSGASEVKAKLLQTVTSVVNASGASECFVNATGSLTYDASGASEVKFVSNPEAVIVQNGNKTQSVTIVGDVKTNHHRYSDTTKVSFGTLDFEVVDGDTTVVALGRHRLMVTDEGNVKWERNRKKKFNGNWGGVDIGLNGYLTPDFNMSFDKANDYLALQMEKSINLNVNIYEQNISLSKRNNMGLVTGLGLTWNNYRFSNTTFLTNDSSSIQGYYMKDVSVRKSKLTAFYLTVPLFYEIQTMQENRNHRFHFAVGALISARLSTHTKIYFNESNATFRLTDPATGETIQTRTTPSGGSRNIVKDFNSYHLAPFKFDVSVRFGYGIINLYATYSLNTMFQKDRGPELYPFSAGITLVGW